MPLRTCVGCREVREQAELLRLARSPGGEVAPDLEHRLPGRGAYACFARRCLEAALKPRALERGFRAPVRPPEASAFAASLAEAIDRKVGGMLGMARRAGRLVRGRSAVEESFPSCLLILWSEDAGGSVAKLAERGGPPHRVLRGFSKKRLGELLGKRPVAVVGVREEGLARALVRWLERRESVAGGAI
ncbi:MAG: DUF448 domain-containing protein [Nitrospinota bacterium]